MSAQKRKTEPVARISSDLAMDQVDRLREIFPECVSEGKIDFDKLRSALGDEIEERPERYSFTWAGKRDAIRLLQTPSRATLIPVEGESVNFDETSHLFIEGDNLEVLKLLHKACFGRVKMIYIDPPYNTGNDFIYPDNFADPLDTYLKLTGQKDSTGNLLTSNPETSGRYHSAWLSMMYPRLFLARQLLREDGVIFVSIDDHEVHNLRMIMNEIFGEENLIACIIWKRRQVADNRNLDQVSTDHEYVVVYGKGNAVFMGTAKDLSKYQNSDSDSRGPWMSDNLTGLATREQRPNLHYEVVNPETGIGYPPHPGRGWIYEKRTMERLILEKRILWPSDPSGRPRLKRFLSEIRSRFTGFSSVQALGYTTDGTREITALFGDRVLAFPKPTGFVRTLCEQTTRGGGEGDDIILDFFAGSCTTAQAVLELNREDGGNRKFIMVQLPEPTNNKDFPTIADIGKERIRRVIVTLHEEKKGKLDLEARDTPEDLGFRVFKLTESHYKPWATLEDKDPETYAKQMELHLDPLIPGWKPENLIWEVAVKEGYGLNSRMELLEKLAGNIFYRVTDPDKGQSFLICLDSSLKPEAVKAISLSKEDLFICRDVALNDEMAANLALQCRLKVI